LSKDLSLAFYGFNQLLYADVDKGFSEIMRLQYMTLKMQEKGATGNLPTASTRRNTTWLVPSPCQAAWKYSLNDSTTKNEPCFTHIQLRSIIPMTKPAYRFSNRYVS
jgi:hypothetical protein